MSEDCVAIACERNIPCTEIAACYELSTSNTVHCY